MNDMIQYWQQEWDAHQQDFNKWREGNSKYHNINDNPKHEEIKDSGIQYYLWAGELKKTYYSRKYLILESKRTIGQSHKIIVPDNSTLKKIEEFFRLDIVDEYGLIVSHDGSSSEKIKGMRDHIPAEKWKEGIAELAALGKEPAYLIHLHTTIINDPTEIINNKGYPSEDDYNELNFFEDRVNVILYFQCTNFDDDGNIILTRNKKDYSRQLCFYTKDRYSMNELPWKTIYNTCLAINNQ